MTAGTATRAPKQNIARSSMLATLVNVSGSALRLVLQVALARNLSVEGFGRFTLARSWGELLARVPGRGYENLALREIPKLDRRGDHGLLNGLVHAARSSTATVACGMVLLGVTAYAVLVGEPDPAIVLGLVLLLPLTMAWLGRSILQAHHRYLTAVVVLEIVQPLAFGASVTVLWLTDALTPESALISWISTIALAAVIQAVVFRRGLDPAARRAPRNTAFDEWRPARRMLFVSRLALVVLDHATILLVGALLGAAEVAAYAVAARVAVLGTIVIAGVQSVAASHLAAAAAVPDWDESQHVIDRSIRFCAVPSLALTLLAAVFAAPIVELFGDDYGDAVTVLRILLIGNLVNSLTGPSGHLVSLSGLERVYARVMWTAAVSVVVLVAAASTWWGVTGAAWAATSVTVGWNVALASIASRQLGVRCWLRPATFHIGRSR